MVVFRGLDDRRLLPLPAAVAVGNFDGLHLGHRRILARLCRLARRQGLRSLVLTFEPHPERALGKRSVRMIDTPDQRLARLSGTCVDAVVVIPFDRAFAGLASPAFVQGVLRDKLGAREVVVGRGFRFGRDRRGDIPLLRRLGRQAGLGVHAVAPAVAGGRTVSSTAVRALVAGGRVEEAARLLGRPYEIAGRVVPGKKRGRLLGYPTANIDTAQRDPSRGYLHQRDRPQRESLRLRDQHRNESDLRAQSPDRRDPPLRPPRISLRRRAHGPPAPQAPAAAGLPRGRGPGRRHPPGHRDGPGLVRPPGLTFRRGSGIFKGR